MGLLWTFCEWTKWQVSLKSSKWQLWFYFSTLFSFDSGVLFPLLSSSFELWTVLSLLITSSTSYPLQLKFPESNEKKKRKYVKSNVVFVEKRENNCLTEEDTKGRKLFFFFISHSRRLNLTIPLFVSVFPFVNSRNWQLIKKEKEKCQIWHVLQYSLNEKILAQKNHSKRVWL